MSLCPRAAAQALQSPPGLSQPEHEPDALSFDEDKYRQHTLHSTNGFGPDQEPLLESQSSLRSTSKAACISHHLAWLIKVTLPRSSPSVATDSTFPSRKRWLPILLIANLTLTVGVFIATCLYFNTFTTLFLYLALLIVAFPILSLLLFAIRTTSRDYKLQLTELSPISTPLSEQSTFCSSGFRRPSSSVHANPARAPSARRYRSCRLVRIEPYARYAHYLFASIWFLAIVEWILFQPMLPSGNRSTADYVETFHKLAATPNTTAQHPMKVFIVSNLYNSEDILPTYAASLGNLIRHLGPENVFVSIYESHSEDQTKPLLAQLDRDLARMNVSRRILSDDRAVRKGKFTSSVQDRVDFLVKVRNIAMEPLTEADQATRQFGHVLWINDIVFTPQDALNLLRTNEGRYDQACAMDFIGNGFYDTWVTRDSEGDTLKRQWPYFKRVQDVEAMREGRPFEVNSCWNGITAFDAKWFYPLNDFTSSTSVSNRDDEDGSLHLPLKFRTSKMCLSSECQLISYDIHRALYPQRPSILVNPAVKIAYKHKHYFLYNSLVPSPLVRLWRIVWRDWISYRLFGWATEGKRWANECKLKQKYWANRPTSQL